MTIHWRSKNRFVSAVCGLLFAATYAQAGFTTIEDSPDVYDEPNLVGIKP